MKKKIIAMFVMLCLLFGICSSLSLAQTIIADVNSDGNINGKDVLALRKFIVGLSTENDVDINACDINADGNVNGKDVEDYIIFYEGKYYIEHYGNEIIRVGRELRILPKN